MFYSSWDSLEAAVEVARKLTEEAIKFRGSFEDWDGVGDAGLIYDADGNLTMQKR